VKWFFEPGHTEAEFRARHMMVTWVRGLYKNIEGRLEFDPANPRELEVETTIRATSLWTGVEQRDNHLRSDDFLGCVAYPEIHFKSTGATLVGPNDYRVTGNLTIRGVTKEVTLDVHYLGTWQTSWWEDGVDKGPKTRAGFTAHTSIDRYEFGVNWNDSLPDGGVVVSARIDIKLDVEAIKEE
jgi:polyisoprenoid-binding protein YceI